MTSTFVSMFTPKLSLNKQIACTSLTRNPFRNSQRRRRAAYILAMEQQGNTKEDTDVATVDYGKFQYFYNNFLRIHFFEPGKAIQDKIQTLTMQAQLIL